MEQQLTMVIFKENLERIKDRWLGSQDEFLPELKSITDNEKKRGQKSLNSLLKQIDKEFKNNKQINKVTGLNEVDEAFKNRLEGYIRGFISEDNIFGLKNLSEERKKDFFRSTEEFLERSKTFDQSLSMEDIGQALRNVWIINILQAVMGERVRLTSAILGYSLLYPYTDNFLDDSNINREKKDEFNDRLMRRLKGERLVPLNLHEEKVYALVELIEKDFDREEYSELYQALQYINLGQIESVKQQYSPGNIASIGREELLDISLLKGGASVLVDGYLVRGRLTPEEIDFSLGYGFMLQLGDDLQDVEEDYKLKHETLMTSDISKTSLDSISTKLINFTVNLIDGLSCADKKEELYLKELIKVNCIMLVLFSVVKAKGYFSSEYINSLKPYLPYSIDYIEGLREKISKWYKRSDSSLL
ncbi:hypothetical protein ACPWSR_12125 [Alloiococcus sp. CFN-8]|uniref:hypothetical protein n=1 Tax=Alloiococcus sp. CFN-8 TaxID=3416081 RepID=UPI003CFAD0C7